MISEGFKIHATPHIHEAQCKCGNELKEVSNGWLSSALFCPKCENVYVIKKVKVSKSKLSKEFLNQCRFEVEFDKERIELRRSLRSKYDKTK